MLLLREDLNLFDSYSPTTGPEKKFLLRKIESLR